MWAGKGWAVFYPNPRGSTNYGEKSLEANINDWGGGDYQGHHDRRRRAGRARHRRSRQAGAHRLELRRLHDRVGDHADHPLQGGDGRRGAHQHVEHVRHQRHPERADRLLRRHPEQADAAALPRSLGDVAHRQGDDADADPARRQRRARAGRAGLRAVSRPQGSRQDHGAGVLPARRATASPSITTRRIACSGSTTG